MADLRGADDEGAGSRRGAGGEQCGDAQVDSGLRSRRGVGQDMRRPGRRCGTRGGRGDRGGGGPALEGPRPRVRPPVRRADGDGGSSQAGAVAATAGAAGGARGGRGRARSEKNTHTLPSPQGAGQSARKGRATRELPFRSSALAAPPVAGGVAGAPRRGGHDARFTGAQVPTDTAATDVAPARVPGTGGPAEGGALGRAGPAPRVEGPGR